MDQVPENYTSKRHANIMEIFQLGSWEVDPSLEYVSLQVTSIQQVPFMTLHIGATKLLQHEFSPVFVGGSCRWFK